MALSSCTECKQLVSNFAAACPHCGHPNQHGMKASVNVSNIDMEFGTMVTFMVKAAIAAIPAAIILVVLGVVLFGILGGLLHR